MTLAAKSTQNTRSFISLQSSSDFVQTGTTRQVMDRALSYLSASFPVHFRPAGTGKNHGWPCTSPPSSSAQSC